MVELEELARSLAAYQSRVDIDPAALQQMEERLNLVQSLQRKYHADESGLIALVADLATRLETVDRREELAQELEKQIAESEAALKQNGEKLTQSRLKASSQLGSSVRKHLKDLGFRRILTLLLGAPMSQPAVVWKRSSFSSPRIRANLRELYARSLPAVKYPE
jgi:DNA repair protein RecN (Recombination protein N)